MNENSKEPVVEQALDNIVSNVSDEKMVNESPSTSNKQASPELNINQNNSDVIDYLSNSIFDDTKEVLIDELLKNESESVEVIDDSRYISTFSEISEKKIISGRVIGMNEKEILVDIGFKSEGIISRNEFNENALPDIGEKINVYLEKMDLDTYSHNSRRYWLRKVLGRRYGSLMFDWTVGVLGWNLDSEYDGWGAASVFE